MNIQMNKPIFSKQITYDMILYYVQLYWKEIVNISNPSTRYSGIKLYSLHDQWYWYSVNV